MHPHPLRGYLFIASAAFLWGVSAALGRAVFTGKLPLSSTALRPIDPLILSQTRTTFSLLVLLLILVASQGWQRIKLPARDLAYCFLLGTLGVAVSNYFYYVAIQRTNVATAIIVQYTAPVWVLFYVVVRGQQKLSLQKVIAVGLAVAGIALVIGIGGIGSNGGTSLRLDSYGMIAALLASFSFAFYNVAGHSILARYDRWRVLVWTLAAAAAFWLIINPPWKIVAAHYVPAQWLFLFVFSMISVLGAFSLYFLGLQYLEPTRAIIASCLEPVFSILLAALLLGEVLRPIQTVGIVFVLAAIVIVQRPGSATITGEDVVVEPME
ncbi:MAG TPA: EamA family transporter [Candidatus Dormibacteraeota bacterium]|nr:EamA family transporter [Candidatus Dormibacteraeota bacterium]